jgi:hypothetical protein
VHLAAVASILVNVLALSLLRSVTEGADLVTRSPTTTRHRLSWVDRVLPLAVMLPVVLLPVVLLPVVLLPVVLLPVDKAPPVVLPLAVMLPVVMLLLVDKVPPVARDRNLSLGLAQAMPIALPAAAASILASVPALSLPKSAMEAVALVMRSPTTPQRRSFKAVSKTGTVVRNRVMVADICLNAGRAA